MSKQQREALEAARAAIESLSLWTTYTDHRCYRLTEKASTLIDAALSAPAEQAPKVLPAEAITGFAAWLTCLERPVTLGSAMDAAPAAEMVEAYRKAQGWDVPREDFASRLKRMPIAAAPSAPTAVQPAAPVPDGMVLAPDYRGYARLGIGAYLINHSAQGEPAELIISIASEEDKAGRTVGDLKDNPEGRAIQPEEMAVRIRFENVAGLDALEQQLQLLREEHFAAPYQREKAKVIAELEADIGGRTRKVKIVDGPCEPMKWANHTPVGAGDGNTFIAPEQPVVKVNKPYHLSSAEQLAMNRALLRAHKILDAWVGPARLAVDARAAQPATPGAPDGN